MISSDTHQQQVDLTAHFFIHVHQGRVLCKHAGICGIGDLIARRNSTYIILERGLSVANSPIIKASFPFKQVLTDTPGDGIMERHMVFGVWGTSFTVNGSRGRAGGISKIGAVGADSLF